jgi:hypothetical protein
MLEMRYCNLLLQCLLFCHVDMSAVNKIKECVPD